MRRTVALLCALTVLVSAACSDGDGAEVVASTTAAPTTTTGPGAGAGWLGSVTTAPAPDGVGRGWGPEVGGRTPLAGFGEVAAVVTAADGTECVVCLMAAADDDQRARGLMEVTDAELGGYDGMVFLFDQDVMSGFWMRNTRLPLSIAYFDADGVLVSQTDMEPCPDSEERCPSYPAAGPFRYAIEVPRGRLDEIGVVGPDGGPAALGDAVLELTGTPCPPVPGSDAGA